MRHFCTYFDFNFLPRGLALYQSLEKNCKEFKFYVLVFDEKAAEYLRKLNNPNIIIITLDEYVDHFQIDMTKYQDKKQFYFSASPNICLYIFEHFPIVDTLFYLDADMYFFNSVEYLYTALGEKSIAICPHRLGKLYKKFGTHYGTFNVGVNGFRNNKEGLECLIDWKNDCESWYPNKPGYPHTFFSDQIFLDSWPSKFKSIAVINNIGIDAAPWNIGNYKISLVEGEYYLDNQPLVVYHFSTLLKISDNCWNTNTVRYFVNIKGALLICYQKYISHIESYDLKNNTVTKLNFKTTISKKFLFKIASLFLNEKIQKN